MKVLLIGLALLFQGSMIVPSIGAPPHSKVITSSNGGCIFKMIPQQLRPENNITAVMQEAFGIAYCLDSAGELKEMWKVSGWYSFDNFLSDDGHYLVRMGSWFKGKQASDVDLALAFYRDGTLIMKYSTLDLVGKPDSVLSTGDRYTWLACFLPPTFSVRHKPILNNRTFEATTTNGIKLTFEITSGKILDKSAIEVSDK